MVSYNPAMRRRSIDRCQRILYRLGWSFAENAADGPGGHWNIAAACAEHLAISRAASRTAAWNELVRLVANIEREG